MSFSAELKDSMVRNFSKFSQRQERVVCGVLQSSCLLKKDSRGNNYLYLSSENSNLVKLLKIYSDNLDSYKGTCKLEKARKGKNRLRYYLNFSDAEKFLSLHGIDFSEDGLGQKISSKINHRIQRKKDYVAGFFLGSGSISNPSKSYHIEFLCKSQKQAENLISLLNELEIKAKYIPRNSFWVVYIKDSEIIADLLSLMGADYERFKFEDTKIIKTLRNKVNRQVNCDTANLNKIADVSRRQVDSIKIIEETVGLENINEKLRAVAKIRLEEPEFTLEELGRLLDPPLGKSGVNYRLNRIEKIAKSLLIEEKNERQDDEN